MAAIYLGPTVPTAVLLPPLRWMDGESPGLPTTYEKQIERARMLSGRQRFNYKSEHPRRWKLSWQALRQAELVALLALNAANRNLLLQNNWEDAAWREVFVVGFAYAPLVKTGTCGGALGGPYYGVPFYGGPYYGGVYANAPLYSVTMTLEEAAAY